MALAVVQRILSGSTEGLPIQVSATAASATLIHTGPTATNVWDRLYLYAGNTSTNNVTVLIDWGPSTNQIIDDVPARSGMYPLIQGALLLGRSAGMSATVIKMGASSSGVLQIYGHVDRVTET